MARRGLPGPKASRIKRLRSAVRGKQNYATLHGRAMGRAGMSGGYPGSGFMGGTKLSRGAVQVPEYVISKNGTSRFNPTYLGLQSGKMDYDALQRNAVRITNGVASVAAKVARFSGKGYAAKVGAGVSIAAVGAGTYYGAHKVLQQRVARAQRPKRAATRPPMRTPNRGAIQRTGTIGTRTARSRQVARTAGNRARIAGRTITNRNNYGFKKSANIVRHKRHVRTRRDSRGRYAGSY